MSHKYFGTDGIRGRANQHPMTAEFSLKIGMAIGAKFINKEYKNRVVIGKDTRLSGYIIESALTSGLTAIGMDVFLVGPTPTPAISMLTKSMRADIGIMISASHNPYYDNGIKIFNNDGSKLSDDDQYDIEKYIDSNLDKYLAKSNELGKAIRIEDANNRYIEFVKSTFLRNLSLKNLKIIIDCANGAAYKVAPQILWELGAEVIAINNKPDGYNINHNCGSTNISNLSQAVIDNKADIGIALDGDADRLAAVDESGSQISGDKLIAIIAERLHDEGKLNRDIVVATQMSNMALEEYLNYRGISLIRANVGDRNVVNEMKKSQSNFGGEQSGHMILSDYSITGDALIATLKILEFIIISKAKSSKINNIFTPYPQKLINISYDKNNINSLDLSKFKEYINDQNSNLAENGRIFARKSGTENLIRILVECRTDAILNETCQNINKYIER